jgi:hypothetical protein
MKLLPPLQAPGPLASLLGANLPSSPGQSRERSINAQRPLPAGSGGPVRPMLNRQPRRARLFSIAPQRHVHQPRTV